MEKRDVHAAVEARRELGSAYDDEIVDSLLAKIDQRLDERKERTPQQHRRTGSITPLALGAMGCGVGATAIAVTNGAGWLAIFIWLAIARIVAAVARYR